MYRDFYGFTRCPFQLAPDPAAYFASLSQRQALSCLSHALAQGEGFTVVTGEVGAGKSTLIGHLLATIEQPLLSVAVVSGHCDGDPIISTAARAFGRTADAGRAGEPGAMHNFLREEAQSARRCLLVIDDAHDLPVSELEALCRLSAVQFGEHPTLQVLLVGQPKLRERLNGHPELEQLRQRVIAMHRLDPLEAGEVERYIKHRLMCVGWSGNPGFAPRVFGQMHAATWGVPARINQIANRLLLLAAAGQKAHIDDGMMAQVRAETIGFPLPMAQLGGLAEDQASEREGPFPGALENALARCERRIAELQQEVAEIGAAGRGPDPHAPGHATAALEERLGSLESRVIEQDGTIRHTLTMLIDWIEQDEVHSVAA